MASVETPVDQGRIEELMGKLIGYMTGGTMCLSIWMGDELGLYRAMAGAGPLSADAVAARAGCNPRLVREWLDSQAAGGLLVYDADADTYRLGAEEAMAFADDGTPIFVARAMNAIGSMFMDIDKVTAAYRGDGKLPWGEHHPCLFKGTEWFFRTGYRAYLPAVWIPALEGVQEKLERGARVADVGCGHGASVVVMADAYPNSRLTGFDYHEPSIRTARERAAEAGVADRTSFEVATAKDYPGTYDLICFFDCLHDMGDPVGIARHALERLDPTAPCSSSSPSPSTAAPPTSPATRWRRCSTPHRRWCARRTRSPRRSASGSAPRPARRASARSSARPASPASAGRPRPRSTSSSRRAPSRGGYSTNVESGFCSGSLISYSSARMSSMVHIIFGSSEPCG